VVSRLLVPQELPTEAPQGNPQPRQVTVSDAVCKGLIQYQTFDSKQRHHTAIALVVLYGRVKHDPLPGFSAGY
jgi:hypothetical protein